MSVDELLVEDRPPRDVLVVQPLHDAALSRPRPASRKPISIHSGTREIVQALRSDVVVPTATSPTKSWHEGIQETIVKGTPTLIIGSHICDERASELLCAFKRR